MAWRCPPGGQCLAARRRRGSARRSAPALLALPDGTGESVRGRCDESAAPSAGGVMISAARRLLGGPDPEDETASWLRTERRGLVWHRHTAARQREDRSDLGRAEQDGGASDRRGAPKRCAAVV